MPPSLSCGPRRYSPPGSATRSGAPAAARGCAGRAGGGGSAGAAPGGPENPGAATPGASAGSASLPEQLTGRQAEVLGLLAAGLSNKQIAAQLYLSIATVERHLATIYRNLGLTGRVEAARFAMENGLA